MVTDEDIQKQWQKIKRLGLAHMNDDTYTLAVTSPLPGSKVKDIDLLVSRPMSKEEIYQHLTNVYKEATACPTTKRQIIREGSRAIFYVKSLI
jgi:C4-type Zn-finger protein